MNLFSIITNYRIVRIWVAGFERSALAAFHRAPGEIVHSVRNVTQ